MTNTKRTKYRIGTFVLVDGLPSNIVAITRNGRGSISTVVVKSWAGEQRRIGAAKLRRAMSL